MRHSINIFPSASIKGQKIQLFNNNKLLNFQQGDIIKIQQNNNHIYTIYSINQTNEIITKSSSFSSSQTSNNCHISSSYIQLNCLHSGIASISKCNIIQKYRQIQIQLSQRDYQIINNKLQIIQMKFLDQVQVVWPNAKIVLFYDQWNFVILMPKVTKVGKVDPYAAISFTINYGKSKQAICQNDIQEEQQEDQNIIKNKLFVLEKIQNNNKNMYGYDNQIYITNKQFNQIKNTLKFNQNQNKLLCYLQSLIPFLKAPKLQQFIQYQKVQKNDKIPQITPILIQIRPKQQNQEQLIDNLNIINFTCSQYCKISCGLSQKVSLKQIYNSNYKYQIKQSITLQMFIESLKHKKYTIVLQKLTFNIEEQQKIDRQQLKIKTTFSQNFLKQTYKQQEFIFFQNYYPFFLNNQIYGLRLKQNNLKTNQSKNIKNFVLIRKTTGNSRIFEQELQKDYQKIKEIQKIIKQNFIIQIYNNSAIYSQNSDVKILKNWIPLMKKSLQNSIQNKKDQLFNKIYNICYQKQLQECIQYLQSCQTQGSILFATYSSNGKTYFHHYLENISRDINFRSWFIDMKRLNSQQNRYDQIKDYLEIFISLCPYKYIFFDNIDAFIPSIEQGDQMRQKQKNISHVFARFLKQTIQNNNKIGIFTAKSQSSINSIFKFNKVIKFKNPNRQTRSLIISEISKNKYSQQINDQDNFNKEQFLSKTQSFSLGAFSYYLINRIIPSNKKSKSIQNNFSKIIGLSQAKKVIKSVIEKPNKFGFIYDKVKIKVPRGILLYGATGNGKTELGQAVQDEFNIKFFSIKGSDILSKYIGGSQAAVREIFEKALSVSPSIIFFDQFQSIVPRRNSSGTGVTDRVVNQFLCYLDGVSSTTGVFIIAASSRPDLIDPALLRPGRIDSHLYLDYPTQSERQQLLQIYSKSVNIQVPVEQIIKLTQNYSYSDMIGLLKQLRIKQSSIILKKQQHPKPQSFKTIPSELFYQTIKIFKIATEISEQKRQSELYLRFKQGKGQDVKKQKLIQM